MICGLTPRPKPTRVKQRTSVNNRSRARLGKARARPGLARPQPESGRRSRDPFAGGNRSLRARAVPALRAARASPRPALPVVLHRHWRHHARPAIMISRLARPDARQRRGFQSRSSSSTGWWSEASVAVSTATSATRPARSSVTKMKSQANAAPGHCPLSLTPSVGA
jgi:hypothetical protein